MNDANLKCILDLFQPSTISLRAMRKLLHVSCGKITLPRRKVRINSLLFILVPPFPRCTHRIALLWVALYIVLLRARAGRLGFHFGFFFFFSFFSYCKIFWLCCILRYSPLYDRALYTLVVISLLGIIQKEKSFVVEMRVILPILLGARG